MRTTVKKKSVRLPGHIRPERYGIIIKPDLDKFTFEGEETVYLTIGKSTNQIILHAKDLEIKDATFKNDKFQISNFKIKYDQKKETVTFLSSKQIAKGRGELYLKFKGELNDKMRGFYRSRYLHNGKEKHLATTQFEATDARRAFPSFDEPHQKAIFDITLIIPPGTKAISNSIEQEIKEVPEHGEGYRMVKFAPTPKMSTYLVAFIVGEFEWVEGRTKVSEKRKEKREKSEGTLVRVFVTPGKKHQAGFALKCATKTLEFYNEYFDISYPLPVLDLIAIPDFSHGAMENWGAVTYRESALLIDPEQSSAANRQWVALVIAHELAHQWFGNLVTMEWWTHLWLNEGFASYIEYLAVNRLFPRWDIWTQFAYNDLGIALNLDALQNTHPIEIEVHHPDEIGEIFDEVSYSKGACIIRMLAGFLGEKDFRDGLRHYLKKHSYSNASTADLWNAFEKISGKPVRKIMQNWTGRPGYPLVKILEAGKRLELMQSRFYSSELSRQQAKDNTTWQIPFDFITDNDQKAKRDIITDREKDIAKPGKAKWIKVNAGETGFYRAAYPPEMLEKLFDPVRKRQLGALDRLGILRDAFALAEAGEMPTLEALKVAENYKNETDYNVIVELATGLDEIDNLVSEEKYHIQYREYCRKIFKPLAEKSGWQKKRNESHTEGLLRSLALHRAGFYGDREIIAQAQKLFSKEQVLADLRGVVYNLVAENGSAKEYEIMLKRYKAENLQEEKNRLGRALGQFKNVGLLEKTMGFILSREVRLQDKAIMITSIWSNDHGKILAWQSIRKNWDKFVEMYPSSGHMLARLIKPAGSFVRGEQAEEVLKFFKTHRAPGLARTIQQVVEKIRGNALWLSRDRDHIGKWLENYL